MLFDVIIVPNVRLEAAIAFIIFSARECYG